MNTDSFFDLYKEANGHPPGQDFWEWVNKASPEELQGEWNYLCQEAEWQRHLRALVLEAQLAKTMADNKVDMATANRRED